MDTAEYNFWAAVVGLITAALTLTAAIIGLVLLRLGRRRPPSAKALEEEDPEIPELTIWEERPAIPAIYRSNRPPVLAVVNMKGGVGKTTITANLAAHFASQGKKVLLIDFDYQGSLTQMVLGQRGETHFRMTAHHLLEGSKTASDILKLEPARRLADRQQDLVRLYPASYAFATIENRLMANWLTGERAEIRYELVRYLSEEAIRSQYDIALIDCPPRITTATINALTSASHVLIPSQPDGLSLPAAEFLSRQLVRMKGSVFPNLKLLGLVPSLTLQAPALTTKENEVLREFSAKLKDIWKTDGEPVLYEGFVPRTGPIRDAAGRGIAYLRNAPARAIFQRLAGEVEKRLK